MTRNITLTADDHLIQQARDRAHDQQTTLNMLFRRWLEGYVGEAARQHAHDALLNRLDHVSAGRGFSRDELNER